jgi:hypothetical protein
MLLSIREAAFFCLCLALGRFCFSAHTCSVTLKIRGNRPLSIFSIELHSSTSSLSVTPADGYSVNVRFVFVVDLYRHACNGRLTLYVKRECPKHPKDGLLWSGFSMPLSSCRLVASLSSHAAWVDIQVLHVRVDWVHYLSSPLQGQS